MNGDPADLEPVTPKLLTILMWVNILATVVLATVLLLGCSGDDDDRIINLPSVPVPSVPSDLVTCHDWNGEKPDKEVRRSRAERELGQFCFVGDICFYHCP